MLKTVDGFPIPDRINWLPDTPDPSLNQWSYGKTITVEVWYGDYWPNYIHGKYSRTIQWKGQIDTVGDYQWFCNIIKQWMNNKFYPLTKEQAIDLWFEMRPYARSNR